MSSNRDDDDKTRACPILLLYQYHNTMYNSEAFIKTLLYMACLSFSDPYYSLWDV
jgi:hypothetical protein